MNIAQRIRNKVLVTRKALQSPPSLKIVNSHDNEARRHPDPPMEHDSSVPDGAKVGVKTSLAHRPLKSLPGKSKNGGESKKHHPLSLAEQQVKPHLELSDLMNDGVGDELFTSKPVARGLAGRPLSETPAVKGARRAHISDCEINVDSLAYWNDPVGTYDLNFQSPFAKHSEEEEQYITFSPDRGGWNNVRRTNERKNRRGKRVSSNPPAFLCKPEYSAAFRCDLE